MLGCRSRPSGVPCGLPDLLIGSSEVGELDRPVDNRDGVAADPDVVSVELNVHAAGTAQRVALARDVCVRRTPPADQPFGPPGVQASGPGILAGAARDDCAYFEISTCAVGSGACADHAKIYPEQARIVRLQCENFRAAPQHHRDPAGTVVDPLRGLDRLGFDAQAVRDLRKQVWFDRARAAQGRGGKGEAVTVTLDLDQAGCAFLHDVQLLWRAAVV